MRVFHNSGVYPTYVPRLRQIAPASATYAEQITGFLADRYGACHILAPVYDQSAPVKFTNGDDPVLQRAWARENGISRNATLGDILLAQIEEHRTEIFYNQNPMRFGNEFIKRLPGSVRMKIAWRAAPSTGGDFDHHDLFVCNFPSILKHYESAGLNAAYFSPSHDPVMDEYASNTDRPIDVIFIGGYSRHHARRARTLERVAELSGQHRIEYYLDRSRMVRLAETPAGWFGPLASHRRPDPVRRISRAPVFGRMLYQRLSQAKIVLNGAVDMAGGDRGNMRCWEAMGCGALLLSDTGRYPDGMVPGETMQTYEDANVVHEPILALLADAERLAHLASSGHRMIRRRYSKGQQWEAFKALVADRC